mgnify:CR=1 FL=1
MPKKLKYYIALVIGLGFLFFLFTLYKVESVDYNTIIFFLILAVAAESLVIQTPNERGISVGFAISLTLILVLGVWQACWISSIGIMLRMVSKNGKVNHIFNTPLYKTLFNGANIMLSSGIAGICYEALGGIPGQLEFINILPIILSIAVYIAVNNLIMTVLMSVLTDQSVLKLLYSNVFWVIRDSFALAPLGIIMAIAYFNYGIVGVLLFFGPLLLARYSFKMYVDMKKIYVDTVRALCQAVEAKDPYTQGHSMRVCELSCKLGERLGLGSKRMENLRIAAMLHDVGKIGVDENILNKPDILAEEEYNKIKEHPVIGAKIIQEINFLKDAANIILCHHERFDGNGYPDGRRCSEISIESGILCVVDVFDALTSDRPYRKAMSFEESLSIIERDTGVFFNPQIANEFIKMMKEEKRLFRIAG